VCAELNPTKGYCVKMVTGEDFIVDDEHPYNGETWWEQRWKMVLVPVDTYVSIKTAFIKLCKKTKACADKIDSWERGSEKLEGNIPKDGN